MLARNWWMGGRITSSICIFPMYNFTSKTKKNYDGFKIAGKLFLFFIFLSLHMGFLKKRSIIHYLDPCMYVSPCLTLSLTWRQERNQGTIIVTRDRSKRSITFLTRQWIAGKIIDISELPPTAQAQTPRRMSIRHGRRKIRLLFVCISPGLLSAIIALETTRIYLRALAKAT